MSATCKQCSPLRILALKAAYNQMPQNEYRHARRKLLTAIQNGEISPEEMNPNRSRHHLPNALAPRSNRPLLLSAAGGVLALAIGAVLLLGSRQPETQEVQPPAPVVNPKAISPLGLSVRVLLDNHRWEVEHVSRLIAQWRAAGTEERVEWRGRLEYRKLRDRIDMKMKELEALSDLSGEEQALNTDLLLELRRLKSTLDQ